MTKNEIAQQIAESLIASSDEQTRRNANALLKATKASSELLDDRVQMVFARIPEDEATQELLTLAESYWNPNRRGGKRAGAGPKPQTASGRPGMLFQVRVDEAERTLLRAVLVAHRQGMRITIEAGDAPDYPPGDLIV